MKNCTIGKVCGWTDDYTVQLEILSVGGKRLLLAEETKQLPGRSRGIHSQAPAVCEKSLFYLFRFTQPMDNNN